MGYMHTSHMPACTHMHTHKYKHKYTHRHIWYGLNYLPNLMLQKVSAWLGCCILMSVRKSTHTDKYLDFQLHQIKC